MALVGTGWVKVKMLPFDKKSEFQIILNVRASVIVLIPPGFSHHADERPRVVKTDLRRNCMLPMQVNSNLPPGVQRGLLHTKLCIL